MRTKTAVVAISLLMLLAACGQVDKVIVAMDGLIAAATVDSIIQSSNPAVLAFDSMVIDDAGQTIDLWTSQPHTTALIGQIAGIWQNLLSTVNPSIGPIVAAIIRAVEHFVSQLQAVTPVAAPAGRSRLAAAHLSAKDNAKVTEMRSSLETARAKLATNPDLPNR